jgi:hypothetical protein
MSEETSSDPKQTPSALRREDKACDSFEDAWKAGERPRIEDYLAAAAEAELAALFRELLRLELYYRRRNGESPDLEEYQERFPGHAEHVQAVFEAEDRLLKAIFESGGGWTVSEEAGSTYSTVDPALGAAVPREPLLPARLVRVGRGRGAWGGLTSCASAAAEYRPDRRCPPGRRSDPSASPSKSTFFCG